MSFSSAPQVELQTSIGNVVVELYVKHAPKTCKNFRELARRGYYNNTIVRGLFCTQLQMLVPSATPHMCEAYCIDTVMQCHRIIKDFMIQAGDPTGTSCGLLLPLSAYRPEVPLSGCMVSCEVWCTHHAHSMQLFLPCTLVACRHWQRWREHIWRQIRG